MKKLVLVSAAFALTLATGFTCSKNAPEQAAQPAAQQAPAEQAQMAAQPAATDAAAQPAAPATPPAAAPTETK